MYKMNSMIPVVMLAILGLARAVHPDQVGKYDWLKQHVGDIASASLDAAHLHLTTSQGVIATLRTADGSLAWRSLLADSERIIAMTASSTTLIAINNDSIIRAWDLNGRMMWDAWLADPDASGTTCNDAAALAATAEEVIVACGRLAQSYTVRTGTRRWRTEFSLAGPDARAVDLTVDSTSAQATVALFMEASGKTAVVEISTKDGSIVAEHRAISSGGASIDPQSVVLVSNHGLVALADQRRRVCYAAESSWLCRLATDYLEEGVTEVLHLRKGCGSDHVLLQGKDFVGAVLVVKTDGLKRVFSDKGVVATQCGSDGALIEMRVASMTNDGLAVRVFSAENVESDKVSHELTDRSLHHATVHGALLNVKSAYSSPQGTMLVQLEEGTVAFFSDPGRQPATWVRREALAEVTDLRYGELPASTPEIEAQWKVEAPQLRLYDVLLLELLALKVQVGVATPEEMAVVEEHRARTSDRLRPTRDADGFRRQIIVSTAAGKVAGLHTGDGRILWSVDFGRSAAPWRLAPWRTAHDVHQGELIAAFGPHDGAKKNDLVATIINTLDGSVVETLVVAGAGDKTTAEILPLPHPLHHNRSNTQFVYVVLGGSEGVAVLPRTDAAKAAFTAQAPVMARWKVSADRRLIVGSVLQANGSLGAIDSPVWEVALAPKGSGLEILTVAVPTPGEAVYSVARPLPDGNLLFKHISPNMLLAIAGPPPGVALERPRLVTMLLDATTGRVLCTQEHFDASGPVHAVLSEHWAAYHFWNTAASRWQIAVLDGYHLPPPGLSALQLALGRAPSSDSVTDASPPTFARQVYNTKLGAVTMGVTQTAHGTTAKLVLLGTPGGQVYQIDRRMLDPRRPLVPQGTKPSPGQVAEGLPPYAPEIMIAGQAFATMDKRVARLRRVSTVPAVLESSCLLAAVGLDFFYTRLQPSRGFDMVPDDFPRTLLVALVGAMTVGLAVLRAMMQQRALKLKWQ